MKKMIFICVVALLIMIICTITMQHVILSKTNKSTPLTLNRAALGELIRIPLDSDDIMIKSEKTEHGKDYTRIYILMDVPNQALEEKKCYRFSDRSSERFFSDVIQYFEDNGIGKQRLKYTNTVYSEFRLRTFMREEARPFSTMVTVTDVVSDEHTTVLLSTGIPYNIHYRADEKNPASSSHMTQAK